MITAIVILLGTVAFTTMMIVQTSLEYPTVLDAVQHGEGQEYVPGFIMLAVAAVLTVVGFVISIVGVVAFRHGARHVWPWISTICLIICSLLLILVVLPAFVGLILTGAFTA